MNLIQSILKISAIIYLTFSLQSCVSKIIKDSIISRSCYSLTKQTFVDKEIIKIIESFAYDAFHAGKKCAELNLILIVEDKQFDSLLTELGAYRPSTVGYCTPENKAIYLRKSTWETGSFLFKRALVYHELGHCVLGLPHKEGISLMNSKILPDYIYEKIWFALVKDMFKQEADFEVLFF